MKSEVCLLALIGCALCMPMPQPQPQGFLAGLAEALGEGLGTIVGLGRNLLGQAARPNRPAPGVFGDLFQAAGTLAGATAAGVGTVAAGKLNAVGDLGLAVGDVLTGNLTGATREIGKAVGSVVGGDIAGAGILAGGVANAAGQIVGAKLNTAGRIVSTLGTATGDVINGKLGAIRNVGAGIGDLTRGNITGAVGDLGKAAGSLIGGDIAAVGALANGTLSILGR